MAQAETKAVSLEFPYDPIVVHHKATELIHQPNEGFKTILRKIPAVEEQTGALFWDMGGKIRVKLDESTELDLNWGPGGPEEKTVLDVGLNKPDGFKLAFITAVHSSPGAESSEKSSFLFAGHQEKPLEVHPIEPVIENTPTSFEKIEELREELKGFIPSEE